MNTRMLRNKMLGGGLGLLLALIMVLGMVVPALAAPVPSARIFQGSVQLCTSQAPENTEVEGYVNDVYYASAFVDTDGNYGYDALFQIDGVMGDTIALKVMGEEVYSMVLADIGISVVDIVVNIAELTTIAGTGGDITEPGIVTDEPRDCDEVVDLLAVPDTCYVFDGWTADSPEALAAIDNPAIADTFITMNGDYTVTANFALIQYTLAVSSSDGGSVTTPAEPGDTYNCGVTADLIATPASGYSFDHWEGDATGGASTSILMDGNKTAHAVFVEAGDTCVLTMESSAGGTVSPSVGDHSYDCDTSVDLVATPDACYQFDGWTGDVLEPGALETSIVMDGDKTVTASFSVIQYELTTNSTEGGEVDLPGEGTFLYPCDGPPADIVALATDPCYEFSHWSGATPEAEAAIDDVNDFHTFVVMDGDYTVTAHFTKIQYNLTTSSTAGGSVTVPGEGTTAYDCGTSVGLEAVAATGYDFSIWTGGVDNPTSATTAITMDGVKDVQAVFVPEGVETCYLTTTATTGGTVTAPGIVTDSPYPCGTEVTLTAEASGCYNFAGWTGDTGTIDDVGAASTTIIVNGDYTVNAVFEIADSAEIPFHANWNTFSTPTTLHSCANTWDEFLALNTHLGIQMIYGYNSATQSWVTVAGGDTIEPLYGYYIKTTSAGNAIIVPASGLVEPPQRALTSGLHLIGPSPASMEDIDVVSMLTTLYMAENGFTGYTVVISPSVNSPDDWVYIRDAADPPMMGLGRAFWLIMENADTYLGFNTGAP